MPTETTTLESVLNLATAMANMDGDVELLQEIVAIFLETAEEELQSLEDYISTGDVGQVAIQAHGMKGGAMNFSASQFVAAALQLELLAKAGTLQGAADLLNKMRESYAELKEVIQVINWDEVTRNWIA